VLYVFPYFERFAWKFVTLQSLCSTRNSMNLLYLLCSKLQTFCVEFNISAVLLYVQICPEAEVNGIVPYDPTQEPIFPSELQVRTLRYLYSARASPLDASKAYCSVRSGHHSHAASRYPCHALQPDAVCRPPQQRDSWHMYPCWGLSSVTH